MQKLLKFAVNEEVEVKKETVSGFLLDFAPYQADGTTVCNLSDFNKVSLDVILERAGREPKTLISGYMEDILVGLYSQTTKFELNKAKRTEGYKCMIDLAPAVIVLTGEDVLRIKVKAENIAFTSLSNANSSIHFETIPAFGQQTRIPVLRSFPIGNGEETIDKECGNQVVKMTLLTDLTATYEASVKAKPTYVDVFANGFEKTASENLVLAENIHYLDYNPESDIQDLVIYSGEPIDSVRVKSKLSAGADASAKLLVIALEEA